MRPCSPTRPLAGTALSKVGHHTACVSLGFHHEPSDDLDLLRIPRRVDHYHMLRYVAHTGHGVLLGSALAYGLFGDFGWECSVYFPVEYGVRELRTPKVRFSATLGAEPEIEVELV